MLIDDSALIFLICDDISRINVSFINHKGHFRILRSYISVLVLPLDVTTPRNSYAWSYTKLAALLALSES